MMLNVLLLRHPVGRRAWGRDCRLTGWHSLQQRISIPVQNHSSLTVIATLPQTAGHRLGSTARTALVDQRRCFSISASRVDDDHVAKSGNHSVDTSRHHDQDFQAPAVGLEQTAKRHACVITGATSGIGYALLQQLLLRGAKHVRVITRDEKRACEAIQQAKEATGCQHIETSVWVQDLDGLIPDRSVSDEMFYVRDAESQASPLFLSNFIHCAGISQETLSIKMNIQQIESIIRTNLTSYMLISSALMRNYFYKYRPGDDEQPSSASTIALSSLLACKGGQGASAYAASKAALVAYNRSLCVEAAHMGERKPNLPGFRTNTLVPGYILTPMTKALHDQTSIKDTIPSRRFGTPTEAAKAIMFLLTNEYANNCVLNLDGGLSAV